MTGAVATAETLGVRGDRRPRADGAVARPRLRAELAAFTALGAVATLQWSRLVIEPPAGRLLLALAGASVAGLALALLGRARLPRAVIVGGAVLVTVAAIAGALIAIGIPARLVLPAHWGELAHNLRLGFTGVEQTELPYDGSDVWLRLALLCVAPALVAIAAALAFWPGRKRDRRRTVALIVLLAAYGIAVTLDSPGAELLWGVVLLFLVAMWLWAPRLPARWAGSATAAVAAAGVLALPVAASLDPRTPWWDYESWSWFGSERSVTFNWDHQYGPLDWPQEGTTLLEVQSNRPFYWKTVVLDRFDGFEWQRARDSDVFAVREQAARDAIPGENLPDRHPGWMREATFQIKALSTPFVVGAGIPRAVQGIEGATPTDDGTVHKFGTELERGDEYSIVTYVPDPTVEELRAAPSRYPERLRNQVLVGLPPAGDGAGAAATGPPGSSSVSLGNMNPVVAHPMALWGTTDPKTTATVEASPYAPAYHLAQNVVADARTPYDAAIAVQRYLHRNYAYNPDVNRTAYPLDSFLFDQRQGYCQQFSGAMALMLRLVGIPSRVVAGFAPGTFDADRGVYTVHDTDAHSWVEVYFRGIGWVTFDPTPAAAPAISQQSLNQLAAIRGADPAQGQELGRAQLRRSQTETPPVAVDGGGGGVPWGGIGLGLGATALAGAAAYGLAAWRRRRALVAGDAADAQLAELVEAVRRLDWGLPPRATLLSLERRFAGARRQAVAGYAATLRAHRFAPGSHPPPGPAARRALRSALAGSSGFGRRLRGLLVIPLGGPRRSPSR